MKAPDMHRVIALAWLSFPLWIDVAPAEIRTFVVSNDFDGYGVDRCLATGASCGAVVASAYCRSQNFLEARSFRKIDRNEVTASGAQSACRRGCRALVAIECTR
jgi:hypothetical protein